MKIRLVISITAVFLLFSCSSETSHRAEDYDNSNSGSPDETGSSFTSELGNDLVEENTLQSEISQILSGDMAASANLKRPPKERFNFPEWITDLNFPASSEMATDINNTIDWLGALARKKEDGSYTTYHLRHDFKLPKIVKQFDSIKHPNKYTAFFDEETSQSLGSLLPFEGSVKKGLVIKVKYKQALSAQLGSSDIDNDKLNSTIQEIKISNQDINDFYIVKSVLIIDCSTSMFKSTKGKLKGVVELLSYNGVILKKEGAEEDSRIVGLGLAPLVSF